MYANCGARCKDGKPCGNFVRQAGSRCYLHGGKTDPIHDAGQSPKACNIRMIEGKLSCETHFNQNWQVAVALGAQPLCDLLPREEIDLGVLTNVCTSPRTPRWFVLQALEHKKMNASGQDLAFATAVCSTYPTTVEILRSLSRWVMWCVAYVTTGDSLSIAQAGEFLCLLLTAEACPQEVHEEMWGMIESELPATNNPQAVQILMDSINCPEKIRKAIRATASHLLSAATGGR